MLNAQRSMPHHRIHLPPPALVLTRAVAETQVHQNGHGGHTCTSTTGSTTSSAGDSVRLDKQMAASSLDYAYPFIAGTTATTASTAPPAPGHGHHHNHHPSVIHEGHSEGKASSTCSSSSTSPNPNSEHGSTSTTSTNSNNGSSRGPNCGQMGDSGSNGVADHASVVAGASSSSAHQNSVDLSTGGNNTGTTSCITHQVSNPEIKVEKGSPMHARGEDTKGDSVNGKATSSPVANCESVAPADAIKSDSNNDNGCQSSAATESKSDVNSSAVTPAST